MEAKVCAFRAESKYVAKVQGKAKKLGGGMVYENFRGQGWA